MKSSRWLLVWFLAFCYASVALVRSWFVPDEYWQSIEVAHLKVFRYGYSTWEWQYGLRSSLYPSIFVGIYRLLEFFSVDHASLLIILPRLAQATMSAAGLVYACMLSGVLFGSVSVPWTALSLSSSWCLFYCVSRTLYNTLEVALSMIGLFYYPWSTRRPSRTGSSDVKYISIAALSIIVRPTAAVIWVPLWIWHFARTPRVMTLFTKFAVIGFFSCLVQLTLDRLHYGRWLFIPYNFLHFNLVSGLSSHYGTHPWHWYATQGVPIVLTSHLVPLALAVWRAPRHPLVFLMVWMVAAYSFLGHKEFRFILPVVPLACCTIGDYLASLPSKSGNLFNRRNVSAAMLLVTNVPTALFFGLAHQRGTLAVMDFLQQASGSTSNMRVLFMMPCHSTPFYSHIHKNISMTFLTCEPNLNHVPEYKDEADLFYEDPRTWLNTKFDDTPGRQLGNVQIADSEKLLLPAEETTLPTHVVMFDTLVQDVEPFLGGFGYGKCAEFFHAYFVQGRVGKTVLVYCQSRAR